MQYVVFHCLLNSFVFARNDCFFLVCGENHANDSRRGSRSHFGPFHFGFSFQTEFTLTMSGCGHKWTSEIANSIFKKLNSTYLSIFSLGLHFTIFLWANRIKVNYGEKILRPHKQMNERKKKNDASSPDTSTSPHENNSSGFFFSSPTIYSIYELVSNSTHSMHMCISTNNNNNNNNNVLHAVQCSMDFVR